MMNSENPGEPTSQVNDSVAGLDAHQRIVDRCISKLPDLIPTDDLNDLKRLRLLAIEHATKWLAAKEQWKEQWRRFEAESHNSDEGRLEWIKTYRALRQQNPNWDWLSGEFHEDRERLEQLITQPQAQFTLDLRLIGYIGDVHAWASAVLNEGYSGYPLAMASLFCFELSPLRTWTLDRQKEVAFTWLDKAIWALLERIDELLTPSARVAETPVQQRSDGDTLSRSDSSQCDLPSGSISIDELREGLRRGALKKFFDEGQPQSKRLFEFLHGQTKTAMRATKAAIENHLWGSEPGSSDRYRKAIHHLNEDLRKYAPASKWGCNKNTSEAWLDGPK